MGQAGLKLLTSSGPPSLASQSAGTAGVSHHSRPNFLIFIEMGSYVAHGGLELLASSDSPVLASQSAEIIEMSHYAWSVIFNFLIGFVLLILPSKCLSHPF